MTFKFVGNLGGFYQHTGGQTNKLVVRNLGGFYHRNYKLTVSYLLSIISHDGLTPSIAFTPTPDLIGTNSPQDCDFNLTYIEATAVRVTAPATDPARWVWNGWYIGAIEQTANKVYNFALDTTKTVIATYVRPFRLLFSAIRISEDKMEADDITENLMKGRPR